MSGELSSLSSKDSGSNELCSAAPEKTVEEDRRVMINRGLKSRRETRGKGERTRAELNVVSWVVAKFAGVSWENDADEKEDQHSVDILEKEG